MTKTLYTLCLLLALQTISSAQELSLFKENVAILSADSMMGRDSRRAEIWMAADYIKKQFKAAGLKAYKGRDYYQRFVIPGTDVETANVIGFLPAKKRTKESVVFIAHYDGLGVRQKENETDSIYNGALDNAVGVAAMISLAKRFNDGQDLQKNLVFIASAAEEIGSYGSKAYLASPLFPREQITFVLNIDGFNVYGKTADVNIMPRKGISYYNLIAKLCKDNGFEDNTPDWVDGLNTSFDSSVFMAAGIPSITIWSGTKLEGMTAEEASTYKMSIGRNHHSPRDEMSEKWRWSGIDDHLRLYEQLALYFLSHDAGGEVTEPALFSK